MDKLNRKDYLLIQKEKGNAIFGVFPAQYPREILWAMNVVPAEIWDPPIDISAANAHLQSYICSVVRRGLELVLQGKCDFLDGFIFPHICDSIQNMASVINDYIGQTKPCYFFYHPKAPYWQSAHQYYLAQLKDLATKLENDLGPLEDGTLRQAIEDSNQIAQVVGKMYERRAQGRLGGQNKEFYNTLRKGEYLLPQDFIPLIERYLRDNRLDSAKQGIPVVLSGVLPNPVELLDNLDQLGVWVAHDDLLNASRRWLAPEMDTSIDPFEVLTSKYFNMPPCTTRGAGIKERAKFLLRLIEETGSKGIIFNIVKFCETEWFDVPNLQNLLKKHGIPSLVLDAEINQGLSGQMATRVEAFIEMIQ